ncbi:MAG TPA: RDD family protein [Schlesneria sp.]
MIPSAAGTSPLDCTVLVSTPENVSFDFRIAGPFSRVLALLIDIAVIGFCVFVIAFILALLGAAGIGLVLFLMFVTFWGYGGLMEAFWNGQTLGKKMVGIRVVSDSGLAINAGQAMLRNILRSADLFPPFFPGAVAMLFGSRFQRLGDLAAGTMVVLDGQRSSPRPPVADGVTERMRERIPAHFRADTALIECLAAYVGRRLDLSVVRRLELSQILARHFIRSWSLPPKINTDHLLCAIYEHATMDEEHRSATQDRDIEDDHGRNDADVVDSLRTLEGASYESR